MADEVHGIAVGTTASFTKTITSEDIQKFAEVSGDDQPLHLDPSFAARTRFKEPIAHGILSASVISAAIGTKLAPGKVVIYMSQNCRFRAPVKPGDTITATLTATAVDVERSRVTLDTKVTAADGTEIVVGDALVMVEDPS
ncbi:MAG: MaoC family dehydratase [Dehalococcoidia bacterium]